MKKPLTLICQTLLALAVIATISPTASAQLKNFTAQAVVDTKADATAVLGEFSPTTSIDPSKDTVTLKVAGTTTSFTYEFPVSAFKKTWFGSYIASGESGADKIGMLLAPLKDGKWAYSAAIGKFVPGSVSVTVNLTVGTETGSATVNAHVY